MLPCCVSKHILKIRVASKLLKDFFPTLVLNFLISCSQNLRSFHILNSFHISSPFYILNPSIMLNPSRTWIFYILTISTLILQCLGRKKQISYSLKGLWVWWFKEWKFMCLVNRSKNRRPQHKACWKRWKENPLSKWNNKKFPESCTFSHACLFCIHMGYSIYNKENLVG